jgi:hypothetical protein
MSKIPRFTRYALAISATHSVPHYAFHWQHKHSAVRVFHLPALGLYIHHLVRKHSYQLSQLPF